MVKCQDIVWEWFAKHYRCYGILAPATAGTSLPFSASSPAEGPLKGGECKTAGRCALPVLYRKDMITQDQRTRVPNSKALTPRSQSLRSFEGSEQKFNRLSCALGHRGGLGFLD